MLRERTGAGNGRATSAVDPSAPPPSAQFASGGLQIVDNLHNALSNGRMQKSPLQKLASMGRTAPPDAQSLAPSRRASPMGRTIALVQSNSLPTLVQRELERMIMAGDLAAGSKLNEEAVADMLGVSRGPVREAFRALEESGLVRLEKNRGVYVRQLSLEEADEIYEIRAVLDGLIGRLAAQRISPPQLARLREIVKRMHAVGMARKPDAYFPLNLEFHEVLAQAAGNRALLANYRRVVNELNLYRRETLSRNADNIPISTHDHEAIVHAIADGDAKRAETLLFNHVLDSRERLHRALQAPPPAARAKRSAP
jgi:phosphonate utilization transcriptional regulator